SVAVLARKSAAKLKDQVGDFLSNLGELCYALLLLEVDDRPHVEQTHGRVSIEASPRVVPLKNLLKAGDVVAQPIGRNGRVLDKRDRLGIAILRHRQPEGCLAQLPQAGLRRRLECAMNMIAKAGHLQRLR